MDLSTLDLPPFAIAAAARIEMNETFYKKVEELAPCAPMTPDQVAEMNKALGLTKDADYRPYCVREGCKDMPRMARTPKGFRCWSCQNEIGFNLQRLP